MHNTFMPTLIALTTLVASAGSSPAADDLKLRPGISFTQDLDSGFPIVANHTEDCQIPPGTVSFIFFGASGDLNTNRQAKRIVELYKKISNRSIKFILVDVDHPPNDDARKLIKSYYKGYIPQQVILDKAGKNFWNQAGEVELGVMKEQVEKCCSNG